MSEPLNQIEQVKSTVVPHPVIAHAVDTFGDTKSAHSWLTTPNPALNDQQPATLALTAEGAKKVDEILTRIDYGIFS